MAGSGYPHLATGRAVTPDSVDGAGGAICTLA